MAQQKNGKPTKKRPRLSPKQILIREKERDAAQRALNGNGMNGSLPPLPVADDGGNEDDLNDDQGAGFGTLFGHPYGALPYGNIHFASPPSPPAEPTPEKSTMKRWHPDIVRHQGLGPLLCQLNDEQLLSVLSFVDGPSLARGVAASSRFLYVSGHHEELWRDLTLRKWGEDGFEVPSPDEGRVTDENENESDAIMRNEDCDQIKTQEEKNGGEKNESLIELNKTRTNRHASGCWRDIYAVNYHKNKQNQTTESKKSNPPKRHIPISVQGIYSDTFFRSWLCRSFALQPSWLSTHTVPMIQHANLTPEIFIKDYEETNTPLLIKGASSTWPAIQKWNKDYFLKVTQGKSFRATSGAAPLPAQFDIENYFNYCASATEEAPLYLFDRTFAKKCPELQSDFDEALKETCPFWDRAFERGHDLFSTLGEGRRPDYQWLIVGPKRSGSAFHIDPNCTHAWNAPIIGRKRWIFYPPGCTPPGVFPSPDGDDVCMPISIGEWFLTYWDAHVERRMDSDISKRPLECTACPGDVLFVPHGWWHLVLNLGDEDDGMDDRGVSVALTRNYVSASNLPDVLRFLDTRVSQISGCRDRGEAVKPNELGREFRNALLSVRKDESCHSGDNGEEKKENEEGNNVDQRGKWTDLLEKSEKAAKRGWQCATWKDLEDEETIQSSSCCSNTQNVRDEKKRGRGTSILSRAKFSSSSCPMQQETNNNGGPLSNQKNASSSNGFSFSFL